MIDFGDDVMSGAGQDLNDMLANAGPNRVADLVEFGDDYLDPPQPNAQKLIVDVVNRGDDRFEGTGAVGAGEAEGAENASPRALGFDIAEMNCDHALVDWGGKAAVVKERPHGPINGRIQLMTFDSLNTILANRLTEVAGADGKIKRVTWARAWLTHPQRREYDGVEFFPNPDGAAGTPGYYNYWKGFEVQPSPNGSYATFRDHIFTNIAGGNELIFRWVFGWMAHIVQKPRSRLGVALVLRGKRGTGKSKFGEVLGSLFAPHYFQVDDARYVTGRFNDHMISCLLLQADEAVWAGDKDAEGRLKGLITSEMQMVEAKNMPAIRVPNYIRVLMTSNEGWVVPAGVDERRFCVLDIDPRCAQDHDYFKEIDKELAAGGRATLLHDLLHFDLGSVDLWQIPQTLALLDQKIRSLDTIDDFLYHLFHDADDWQDRIVCDALHGEYVKATRIGRPRGSAEFGKRLAKLLPGLRKTRPLVEISPGVMKPKWCYEIPSLHECREAFSEHVGQPIDWPALPGGGGPASADVPFDDDAIPV